MELLHYILKDIKEPITYLPAGLLVGEAVELLLYCTVRRRKKQKVGRAAADILLFAYLVVVFIQAFFSREPGSRSGIDLVPFSTWGTTWQAHAYMIENIIMFLPLGMLLPAVNRKVRWRSALGMSLGLSATVELLQLVTQRGYCQMDDILMNTLGGCIGYMIQYCLRSGIRGMRRSARS